MSSNYNEPYVRYFFDNEDFELGFPATDFRFALVTLFSLFPKDTEIVLDYTELIVSGYYEEDDDLVDISTKSIVNSSLIKERIIILAEGKYDIFVLRESLKLLYPDLIHYFGFLDFNTSKAPGGVGNLSSYLKVVIGAGISDRILAVFDNDSAAYDAIRNLKKIDDIPDNIAFINYPNFDLFNSYPTIGPNGIEIMNINKLACSIELYLGKEILLIDNNFSPIQWTGFIKSIKKYQGEILEKNLIQKRFQTKLDDCKKNRNHIANYDWSGIINIWESIFEKCGEY